MTTILVEPIFEDQARRFSLPQTGLDREITFSHPQQAVSSPLARKILSFPWAQEVRLGPNYIIIFKQDWIDWHYLEEPLKILIQEHLENQEPIVLDPTQGVNESPHLDAIVLKHPQLQPLVEFIKGQILPILQADGGWLEIRGWHQGILYLSLEGACGRCPSSQATWTHLIKDQILKHFSQFVQDVQLVSDDWQN